MIQDIEDKRLAQEAEEKRQRKMIMDMERKNQKSKLASGKLDRKEQERIMEEEAIRMEEVRD
mgnify:CR=1 FL=1|tara:strand:+ start:224 stop:409 length:186 start_codon:yes stop_codon:yes gene_type:complete